MSGKLRPAFLAAPVLSGLLAAAVLACAVPRARLAAPAATPLFEDRRGRYLSEGPPEAEALGFWDVGTPTPDRIKRCILAVEDRRFYSHPGVDPHALARALAANLFLGRRQGASTIAMQVARMQRPAPRTLWNKALETVTALLLVQRYGHETVLRHYMRIAPQGSRMHGFAYAARRFFRKPLGDLSWAEAALLASLPKAPDRLNLFRLEGFSAAVRRARLILRLLRDQKMLDTDAYRRSIDEISRLPVPVREWRPEHSYHFILRLLERFDSRGVGSDAGDGGAERSTAGAGEAGAVEGGTGRPAAGRPVRTTLDAGLQEWLHGLAAGAAALYRDRGAGNIAVIVADRRTGGVLGYVGSADYYDEAHAGAINYARVPRSSGSTLKPFLYALGLETGAFTPASVLADLPLHVVSLDGGYSYSYSNFDEDFLGPTLYRRALANSRNIPAVRVLEAVGMRQFYGALGALGLHTAERPAEYYGFGLALGGLYVTLEDLVAAYGVLAHDGRPFALRWTTRGEGPDREGGGDDVSGEERPAADRILSEAAARTITLFLSDSLARLPSFPRLSSLEFPFPVAVKTGTSQGFRDAWAVGYSTEYVVGVWIGHPDNQRMNHVGSLASAGLVQRVFRHLQPEASRGINTQPFPPPRDSEAVRICTLSGHRAGRDCPQVTLEYFRRGTEPEGECPVHRRFAVDRGTGALADSSTPAHRVITRVFTLLPPQYAAWGARRGYGPPGSGGRHRPATVPAVADAAGASRTAASGSSRSTPADPDSPPAGHAASIRILEPPDGARYVIDPATPRSFQTLPLRAEVSPTAPAIVWYVDGEEYRRVDYPYETRWQLDEGEHTIRAGFVNARILSDPISIRVAPY